MTPQELVSTVSSGQFRPVYYFFGTEDYRITEAEKYVAHQFLPDKQISVNYTRLDGRKTKCADVLATLSVYPLLGERQVVSLSDIQSFKPAEVDRILGILKPPDPNRIVVLTSPSARQPKKTSAVFRKLAQEAAAIEFIRLTAQETESLIRRKLTKAQLEIEPPALQLLVELVAGNRGALELEVNKLIDFKNPGERLGLGDIEQVAAGFEVHSVFELADAIVRGDRAEVLKMINGLLADGNTPTSLMFFLGQHFLTLYNVKHGRALESYRQWLTGKFRNQAARFEVARLEAIVLDIAETDAALRHEAPDKALLLEQLVLRLMTPSR